MNEIEVQEEIECRQALEAMLDSGNFEGTAVEGIMKQAIDKGEESLTKTQSDILDQILDRKCEICGDTIILSDIAAGNIDSCTCHGI